uniref:Poly [ADP-ribose] polymerase n=1 Tax=Cyprinodon variegatus TaxID=28743 RepID=A0A3Q2CG68_CYPVA
MRRTRGSRKQTQSSSSSHDSCLFPVWQWRGDDGQWEVYPDAACSVLESAVSSGKKTITLTLGAGRKYKVDLEKMIQINPATKYKREIRCQAVKEENLNEDNKEASQNGAPAQIKEEEEEAAEEPVVKKRKGQSKAAKKPKEEIKTEAEVVKTVVMKGKAPVDPECKAKLGQAHVYCEGDDVYDVMLNQTNLQFNNNKYYLIQLLEDDGSKVYSVWMRWGRVGKVGQNSLVSCGSDLKKAKDVFKEKKCIFSKTAVDSVPKKQPSKLDPKVYSLLELICDIKAMEECVLEMKFDTKKAPLGKLTQEQIRAGYEALKAIESCLKKKGSARNLLEACNAFYTRIPHDFGLKPPPMIKTEQELKEKIALLEALGDIQIAVKMAQSNADSDEHPLDRQYRSLQCQLQPLDHSSNEFKLIEKYLQSTHAPTHCDYTMTLLDIFSVDRGGESDSFLSHLHNKTLLWHGSRLTNWVGILSKGLRVAPPEAPTTGYMFGKGIYFADMSSKSANYCHASQSNHVGFLLLCEVALGDCNELLDADYEGHNLPPGKHSTKGLGQTGPDPRNAVTLNGMTVPMGPGVKTKVSNPGGYSLLYNEFIVYNPAQTRMRYLLRIQFNYASLW